MNHDIHAEGPAQTVSAYSRRHRLWPWLLGTLLVLALLAAGALAALWAVVDTAHPGMHVIVNGQAWDGWDSWEAWDGMGGDTGSRHGLVSGVGVLMAVLAAGLVVLLVVPFTVLLGLLLGLMGLAIGLAVTVGTVGLVAALQLSPLWGLGLLLWLIFRRRSPPTPSPAARMTA